MFVLQGKNDFSKIPHGHNGVEERLAVIWDKLVASEKSTATKFVSLSSSSAAKMLNIWPQKGRIEAESDADIIIWNPNNGGFQLLDLIITELKSHMTC